jgi:hypothetical protein
MSFGGRFDFEAAREKQRAKKAAAMRKKIIESVVTAVVFLSLIGGGWYGIKVWREKVAEEKAAREAAEMRQAQERAKREREAHKRREEARIKREQERKAQEEERKREREAREAERKREAEERQRLLEEERKEKARLEEERKWQEVNKSFADKSVSELHFDPSKYVTFELGCSGLLSVSVSDKRWEELAQQSASKSTIDFLRTLNSKGIVTNGFSEARYPDHQTVRDILALLENERFTLVLKVVENAKMPEDGINVFSPNLAEGVAVPRGARELRATDGSIIGMTLPITYGKMQSVYVMRNSTAARIRDDWAAFRAKVQREAKKSDNPVEHERTRLRGEIEDFMSSVRVQLASPSKRVIAKPEPKKIQKEKEKKPRVSPFKGMNTNRRSFN